MFTFDPVIEAVQQGIVTEIQRVAAQDPRISVNYVQVFPQDNGILVEIEVQIVGGTEAQLLNLFFNSRVNLFESSSNKLESNSNSFRFIFLVSSCNNNSETLPMRCTTLANLFSEFSRGLTIKILSANSIIIL